MASADTAAAAPAADDAQADSSTQTANASAANEMFAMAKGSAPATTAAAPEGGAAGGAPAPFSPGRAMPGGSGSGYPSAPGGSGGSGGGYPTAPGGSGGAVADSAGGGGGRAGRGMFGGEVPGGPGGQQGEAGPAGRGGMGAMGGQNAGPANYRTPPGAATAFLAALTARDKTRLSEATALRARTEADKVHQEMFSSISDQSISDDQLDALAKSFEGYQIRASAPDKSTGMARVVVGKAEGRVSATRAILVRVEKGNWRVYDFTGKSEIRQPGMGMIRKNR